MENGKTSEERELILERLQRAQIPLKYRSLTSKDLLPKGRILFDYLQTTAYASDVLEGRGICLSGDPAVRSDLLAMMAKSAAIAGRSTRLISLHLLVPILENNGETRDLMQRADFLFVDLFEREFRSDDCPYTLSQICDVEDFLLARMAAGKPTSFAACRKWDQLRWYSRDFLGGMTSKVRDICLTA